MSKVFPLFFAIGAVVLAGCGRPMVELELVPASRSGVNAETNILSSNYVTTPNGLLVGESKLRRGADKMNLWFKACCLLPQNAYTAWWLIGDVDKSILAVRAFYATGFVAESEMLVLELELQPGDRSFEDPSEGIRLVVLDHGPSTGNPLQLTTPGGGCPSIPCPIVLTTAHPSP